MGFMLKWAKQDAGNFILASSLLTLASCGKSAPSDSKEDAFDTAQQAAISSEPVELITGSVSAVPSVKNKGLTGSGVLLVGRCTTRCRKSDFVRLVR